MKVQVGTKVSSDRTVEVELTDLDGEKIFQKDWEELTVEARFKRLAAYADVLVLEYLLRDGFIIQSIFNEKLHGLSKELQAK